MSKLHDFYNVAVENCGDQTYLVFRPKSVYGSDSVRGVIIPHDFALTPFCLGLTYAVPLGLISKVPNRYYVIMTGAFTSESESVTDVAKSQMITQFPDYIPGTFTSKVQVSKWLSYFCTSAYRQWALELYDVLDTYSDGWKQATEQVPLLTYADGVVNFMNLAGNDWLAFPLFYRKIKTVIQGIGNLDATGKELSKEQVAVIRKCQAMKDSFSFVTEETAYDEDGNAKHVEVDSSKFVISESLGFNLEEWKEFVKYVPALISIANNKVKAMSCECIIYFMQAMFCSPAELEKCMDYSRSFMKEKFPNAKRYVLDL